MAIAIAIARPEINLLGVTVVAGNSTLPNTFLNTRRVLALLGAHDMPVAAGAAVPLVRPLFTAAYVHGESGLEGADLPEPAGRVHEAGAVDLIATLVAASPEPVVLAPLGPLTNIAMFIQAHPELISKIAHISWMGGAVGEGNVTSAAEFNVYVDPDAAAVVFASGIPITMVGLDATHLAKMGAAERARLEATGKCFTKSGMDGITAQSTTRLQWRTWSTRNSLPWCTPPSTLSSLTFSAVGQWWIGSPSDCVIADAPPQSMLQSGWTQLVLRTCSWMRSDNSSSS
jgi:inosine-uridine nucleoside N-ribohydrolase